MARFGSGWWLKGRFSPAITQAGAGGGAVAFDPTAFFDHYFNANDLTSLKQNSDGTGDVTTVGDRVGYIADQSGSLHLKQTTAGSRGTLRQHASGQYYIECAIGQSLWSDASFTTTLPCYLVAAETPVTVGSSSHPVFGARSASNSSLDVRNLTTFNGSGGVVDATHGSSLRAGPLASVSIGVPVVLDCMVVEGWTSTSYNGGDVLTAVNAYPGDYSAGSRRIGVNTGVTGGAASGTNSIHFYGGGIKNGAVTESERAAACEWAKALCGITALESQTYDLFALAGQSNCSGQGDYTSSVAVPWGEAIEYSDGAIKPLADPTRHYATTPAGNVSDTGSLWPSFSDEYFALTGRRVCIVGGAVSGVGFGGWNSNAAYRDALAAKSAAAIAFLEGKGATVNFMGVLWQGGEADAEAGSSAATVETAMGTLLTNMRTAFADASLPMYYISIDNNTDSGKDAAYAAVRTGIVNGCTNIAGLELVMPFQDFEGSGLLDDTVHWGQTALNTAGNVAATNVAALIP